MSVYLDYIKRNQLNSASEVFDALLLIPLSLKFETNNTTVDKIQSDKVLKQINEIYRRYKQNSIQRLRQLSIKLDINLCPKSSILTWRADKALEWIIQSLNSIEFDSNRVIDFIQKHKLEIYNAGLSVEPDGPCLASIMYDSVIPENRVLKENLDVKLIDELYDYPVNQWLEVLSIYLPKHLKGGLNNVINIDENVNDYITAVQCMSQLVNVWDRIKISRVKPNDSLTPILSITPIELFKIYSGQYQLIPSDYKPISQDVNIDFIFNQDYNIRLVRQFLYDNYNTFIKLLTSYTVTVCRALTNLDVEGFKLEIQKYKECLSYYTLGETELIDICTRFKQTIGDIRITQLFDGVNLIIHSYIPELLRLKNIKGFSQQLGFKMITAGNNSMILGVSSYLDDSQPINSTKTQSGSKNLTHQSQVTCNLTGGDENKHLNFDTHLKQSESSSFNVYYNKLINTQHQFVTNFYTIYMKFIRLASEYNFVDIKSGEVELLKPFYNQLRKLAISNPNTGLKLSGIIETNDFNEEYVETCRSTIKALEPLKNQTSSSMIKQLEELINVLVQTHKTIHSIRLNFLKSSKNVVNFMETNDEYNYRIKLEILPLTSKDIELIKLVLGRYLNITTTFYKARTSESSKAKLTKYVNDVKSRTEAINKFYADKLEVVKYLNSQLFTPKIKKLFDEITYRYRQLITTNREASIWLNESVDTFEIKDRIKQINNSSLTIDKFREIGQLYLQVDKYTKLKNPRLLKSYSEFIEVKKHNVQNYFKCYQLAKETIEEIGCINYLERLYSILGIVDTKTKEWIDFKVKLIGYLASSLIWFDVYHVTVDDKSDGHKGKVYTPIEPNKYIPNIADYDNYVNELDSFKLSVVFGERNNKELFKSIDMLINPTKAFGDYVTDNVIDNNSYDKAHLKGEPGVGEHRFTLYGHAILDMVVKNNLDDGEFVFGFNMNPKDNEFLSTGTNESFYSYVFKSLFTPVLEYIDKYIKNVHISKPIPTATSYQMMGGNNESNINKIKAGSIYDVSDSHFKQEVRMYKQAIRCYLSVYGILKHYIKLINESNKNEVQFILSSDSPLSMIIKNVADDTYQFIDPTDMNNIDTYISFVNKYWNLFNDNDVQVRTSNVIDKICNEINTFMVFKSVDEAYRLGHNDNTIDLSEQNEKIQKILEKIDESLNNAILLYSNAGVDFDKQYQLEMEKFESKHSTNKSDLINWINQLYNGKQETDTTQDKFIIDFYYAPYFITLNYYLQIIRDYNDNDKLGQLLQKLMYIYGATDKTTLTTYLLKSVHDFAYDIDNMIHHLIECPLLTDSGIEQIKRRHDELNGQIQSLKSHITTNSVVTDKVFINSTVLPSVLTFKNYQLGITTDRIERFIDTSYYIADGARYQDNPNDDVIPIDPTKPSYIKSSRNTFTEFITYALTLINRDGILPEKYISLLKDSNLNNNTFTTLDLSDKGVNVFDFNASTKIASTIIYQKPVINIWLSLIIEKSSIYHRKGLTNELTTPAYYSKLVSIIPILLYLLQLSGKTIVEGHEVYELDELDYLKSTVKKVYINSKSEIELLTSVLKNVYIDALPYVSQQPMLVDTQGLQHCFSEIRYMIENNRLDLEFVFKNIVYFEWIMPTLSYNVGVEYIKCNRYDNYFKSFNVTLDDKNNTMTILKSLGGVLLKQIFNYCSFVYNQQFQGRLIGGDKIDYQPNPIQTYTYDDDQSKNITVDTSDTALLGPKQIDEIAKSIGEIKIDDIIINVSDYIKRYRDVFGIGGYEKFYQRFNNVESIDSLKLTTISTQIQNIVNEFYSTDLAEFKFSSPGNARSELKAASQLFRSNPKSSWLDIPNNILITILTRLSDDHSDFIIDWTVGKFIKNVFKSFYSFATSCYSATIYYNIDYSKYIRYLVIAYILYRFETVMLYIKSNVDPMNFDRDFSLYIPKVIEFLLVNNLNPDNDAKERFITTLGLYWDNVKYTNNETSLSNILEVKAIDENDITHIDDNLNKLYDYKSIITSVINHYDHSITSFNQLDEYLWSVIMVNNNEYLTIAFTTLYCLPNARDSYIPIGIDIDNFIRTLVTISKRRFEEIKRYIEYLKYISVLTTYIYGIYLISRQTNKSDALTELESILHITPINKNDLENYINSHNETEYSILQSKSSTGNWCTIPNSYHILNSILNQDSIRFKTQPPNDNNCYIHVNDYLASEIDRIMYNEIRDIEFKQRNYPFSDKPSITGFIDKYFNYYNLSDEPDVINAGELNIEWHNFNCDTSVLDSNIGQIKEDIKTLYDKFGKPIESNVEVNTIGGKLNYYMKLIEEGDVGNSFNTKANNILDTHNLDNLYLVGVFETNHVDSAQVETTLKGFIDKVSNHINTLRIYSELTNIDLLSELEYDFISHLLSLGYITRDNIVDDNRCVNYLITSWLNILRQVITAKNDNTAKQCMFINMYYVKLLMKYGNKNNNCDLLSNITFDGDHVPQLQLQLVSTTLLGQNSTNDHISSATQTLYQPTFDGMLGELTNILNNERMWIVEISSYIIFKTLGYFNDSPELVKICKNISIKLNDIYDRLDKTNPIEFMSKIAEYGTDFKRGNVIFSCKTLKPLINSLPKVIYSKASKFLKIVNSTDITPESNYVSVNSFGILGASDILAELMLIYQVKCGITIEDIKNSIVKSTFIPNYRKRHVLAYVVNHYSQLLSLFKSITIRTNFDWETLDKRTRTFIYYYNNGNKLKSYDAIIKKFGEDLVDAVIPNDELAKLQRVNGLNAITNRDILIEMLYSTSKLNVADPILIDVTDNYLIAAINILESIPYPMLEGLMKSYQRLSIDNNGITSLSANRLKFSQYKSTVVKTINEFVLDESLNLKCYTNRQIDPQHIKEYRTALRSIFTINLVGNYKYILVDSATVVDNKVIDDYNSRVNRYNDIIYDPCVKYGQGDFKDIKYRDLSTNQINITTNIDFDKLKSIFTVDNYKLIGGNKATVITKPLVGLRLLNQYSPNINGGDLLFVDKNKILNYYMEQDVDLIKSLTKVSLNNFEAILLAYYSKLITTLKVDYSSVMFIEILYNHQVYKHFFNALLGYTTDLITNNADNRIKYCYHLINLTCVEPEQVKEEDIKPLTNYQQVVDNYLQSYVNIVTVDSKTFVEPINFRKFLNQKVLLPYHNEPTSIMDIVNQMKSKIFELILTIERTNISVAAAIELITHHVKLEENTTITTYNMIDE